ncbi:hypothetical protein ACIBI3_37735 [Actinomadura luteofluorescens]|uniref:hypothetical protein n=1 Tax=Actinomadura luteofluorescens TaxID=46163 RepID=UPI00346C205F
MDIIGFGRRDSATQSYLRAALYGCMTGAFIEIGLPLSSCHIGDRGDGILVVAGIDISPELLLRPLATELHARIQQHNAMSIPAAEIRMRTAVNGGYVQMDTHGVSGKAVVHLYRMLDAPPYKSAMEDSGADLGLIISDHLYREVVQGPCRLKPLPFSELLIEVKETVATSWLWHTRVSSVLDGQPHQDA